jgi:hypothetical protein
MSEALTVITQLSALTFIITSMLAMGLSLTVKQIGYFVESAASAQLYLCFQPPPPKPRMSVSVSRGFPVAFC